MKYIHGLITSRVVHFLIILIVCVVVVFWWFSMRPEREAREYLSNVLLDVDTAKFSNVKYGGVDAFPAICGSVNAKNSFGTYVGFSRFVISKRSGHVLALESSDANIDRTWDFFCK